MKKNYFITTQFQNHPLCSHFKLPHTQDFLWTVPLNEIKLRGELDEGDEDEEADDGDGVAGHLHHGQPRVRLDASFAILNKTFKKFQGARVRPSFSRSLTKNEKILFFSVRKHVQLLRSILFLLGWNQFEL
jgi:hypothetical protein